MNIKTGFVVALMLSAVVAVGCGMNVKDLIRTRTPAHIQQTENLPASMPLSQSEGEYESWRDKIRRQDQEWRERLRQGNELAAVISTATLQFATVGEAAVLGAAPWAAPFIPLAAWALGAFVTKRPGDVPKDESDNLWDEAFARGRELGKAEMEKDNG